MRIKNISWNEFDERCKELASEISNNKKILSLYGIPRGGLPIAVTLSHLTGLPLAKKPNFNTTAIIDDILDTGTTRTAFNKFKYFFTLTTKTEEEKLQDVYYKFPWEMEKI